ncbi:hypothetical protein L1887_35760 [Cichorium endivia]|nr:hypothetical protein L1887_35760 [Cichorium endivia]
MSACCIARYGIATFMLGYHQLSSRGLILGIITGVCFRYAFAIFRAKMKNKTEQEIALLRQHDQAWNVYGVLNFMQALMEKSSIIQILEQEKEGLEQFTAIDGYDYNGGSNVLKVLGYFSMVRLLRVHCLLGDYQTGLKCLLPIDISQQGVYTSVIGSHITTIYHYGFANIMLRRF